MLGSNGSEDGTDMAIGRIGHGEWGKSGVGRSHTRNGLRIIKQVELINMPTICLLVTDLDNALYDWVTFFSRAFYDMVGLAASILGVSEDLLLDELQEVHRNRRDTEYPFALLETRTVLARHQE